MRGLIGKKIGMTQVYNEEGTMIPVTIVEAGPCTVIQVKSINNDGYEAVQVGFGERKAKHVNKPLNGQFKKSGVQPKKILMEFNIVPGFNYKEGQEFNVSLFKEDKSETFTLYASPILPANSGLFIDILIFPLTLRVLLFLKFLI